jgi:hypothetical protein
LPGIGLTNSWKYAQSGFYGKANLNFNPRLPVVTTLPFPPLASLAGKTVLITAAAQGIGRASALACLAAGAEVIATDIQAEGLETLRAETSGRLRTTRLDVRDTTAQARALQC